MKTKIILGIAILLLGSTVAVATSGIPMSELAHHLLCYIGLDGEVVHVGH